MKLRWSDDAPPNFDWGPVRTRVEKLVANGEINGKTVADVLQSRNGGNSCSTRANVPMKTAWHASGTMERREGGLWTTQEEAVNFANSLHDLVGKPRKANEEVKVKLFSFALKDATGDTTSRFLGSKFHCVWLIDGGVLENGWPYFVVYDQDVTCSQRAEVAWRLGIGAVEEQGEKKKEEQKKKEAQVDTWALSGTNAKPLVRSMLLDGRNEGPLGPLIRFLYVEAW